MNTTQVLIGMFVQLLGFVILFRGQQKQIQALADSCQALVQEVNRERAKRGQGKIEIRINPETGEVESR